jgi:hypothetical protein
MAMQWNPEDAIEEFVNSPKRSAWLHFHTDAAYLKIYVRKANHVCGHILCKTLDIASVGAYPQGTGAFTRLVDVMERIAAEHQRIVFVESILEERLIGFLHRRGYAWQDTPGLGFSMYKPT